MISFLIQLIQLTATVLTLIILADVILSFFMNPFHPLRQSLDMIVEPMLAPIRRIMPNTGMLDFSPLILLILIQLLESVLVQLLFSLR
ncbi:MAG: YggT family protein [Anaerolineales bacterium]